MCSDTKIAVCSNTKPRRLSPCLTASPGLLRMRDAMRNKKRGPLPQGSPEIVRIHQLNEPIQARFRRKIAPMPSRTVPSSRTLPGSGTAVISAGMVPVKTAGKPQHSS